MPQHRYATYRILILLAGLLLSGYLFAAGISSTEKYAWAENAGWLNFAATSGNVQVYADHLEGYIWAENIGWIRLGTRTIGGTYTYSNTSNTDYGVNRTGTNLSGYAWSENVGWINFNSANGGPVTLNVSGQFDGYAWSENVGWIHLRSATPTAYGVALEPTYALTIASTGTGSGTISGGGSYAAGATVTLTATPTPGSTFAGWSPAPCATTFVMPASVLTCTATFNLSSYSVTPSAGANGSISPNTVQTVPYAGTTTFIVTPTTIGYTASVTGCGGSLTGNLYLTGPITSDCTVSASFIPATAALVVTKLADTNDGFCNADCSLREAVAVANTTLGANTITFAVTGTISQTGGEIPITDDLTIQGPGAANLVIDGNNLSRIFTIATSKTVVIDGLTLRRGFSVNPGGAILNDGGILTVSHSALANNQSTWASAGSFRGGGAIANNPNGVINGTLTVTDSTLSGNTAVIGGAINNQGGCTATVRNSILSSNTATDTGGGGGGIFSRGMLTVDSTTLSSNSAVYKGGGILAWASTATSTFLTNSTVSANTAKSGGGLSNEGTASTVDILNSTLSGNSSNGGIGYGGGGILNSLGTLKVINSTVSVNTSTNTGGGIENSGLMTLTNSTLTGNSATGSGGGGGIYAGGTVTTGNSLITANTAPNGPEIRRVGGGTFTSLGNNLFGQGGVSGVSGATVAVGEILAGAVSTVIDSPPPALPANNGGPTATYLLKAGGPAIDAGNNALIPAGITADQRGAARISGLTTDIGAVESGSVVTYTVYATAGLNGSISLPTSQTVNAGAVISPFTVAPDAGYTATVTGCGAVSTGINTYTTAAINANCTVVATFTALPTYTVTPSAGANGSISPNTPQPATLNQQLTFTVSPNIGYTASVGGTCGGTLVGTLFTTAPITANCTVIASFALITYTVTPSAGANGSISPVTPQPATLNQQLTFTVSPNINYTASVGGTCGGTLVGTLFTTAPITADCTVVASFAPATYTVTPSAGANGSISPVTPQPATLNQQLTFTVSPNIGYTASVGGTCGGTLVGTLFTTAPITADCTVVASFAPATYTVTPSAGANGSISPVTPQPATLNQQLTFTVSPSIGYTASVGGTCGGTLVGTLFTTAPITADCTVVASFSSLPTLSINGVSQNEGNTGSTPLVFTVTLSAAAALPVTVNWATANDTATAGSDYTAASGSLTFAPGVLTQPVTVQITGDTLAEPNETFFVNLSTPVNATMAQAQGTGTILNDDGAARLTGIAWSSSQFVTVGEGGTILTSLDGIDWLPVSPSPTGQDLYSVAWSGSRFVAVGSTGTVLTSPNGTTWNGISPPPTTQDLNGIVWSGGQFVVVGSGGAILTSPNGATWTPQSSGTPQPLYGIAWSGSQFVAVGSGGTILTSATGTTWTPQSSGTTQPLYSIAWSGSEFVAVGGAGTILASPNGLTWNPRSSGTPQDLRGIAWSGSQFLTVGSGGAAFSSPDSNAWTAQTSGTSQDLYGVIWAGSLFIAVGDHDTILPITVQSTSAKVLDSNVWTAIALPVTPTAPGTVQGVLGNSLGGTYDTDWVVWGYDPVTYQSRKLTATDSLIPGRGYWIRKYSPGSVSLTATGTATPVTAGNPNCSSAAGCYEIALTAPPGGTSRYTLIGMPFPYPVGWWDVRLQVDGVGYALNDPANGYVAPSYWLWNGNGYDSYNGTTPGMTGILQPWQGFWMQVHPASQGHSLKLLIPPIPKYGFTFPSSLPAVAQHPAPTFPGFRVLDWLMAPAAASEPDDPAWYVRLIAETSTPAMRDRNNVFGQIATAAAGHDPHDLPKLAPFSPPSLSVVFPHPDWGPHAGDYASDYRPNRAASTPGWPADRWRFAIRTDRAGYPLRLRWEGPPDILSRSEVIDEDTGSRYPANDPALLHNGIPLTMTAPVRYFTWIFAGQPEP